MTNSRASKVITINKKADETVNNSSTLQDDNELKLSVLASKQYSFIMLILTDASTTADFKFNFTVPSGATGTRSNSAITINPSGTAAIATVSSSLAGTGATASIIVHGTILTSTTSGTLQLQWAQQNATAENTKVLKGSYIMMWL